ncbi:MAG: mycothiol synthase [Actinomycetota bacterium]|nr:mycothiol synthase [Actinomycetota bacterium]
MRRLEIKRSLDDHDRAAVEHLLRVAERADGHPPVDEHRWLDMAEGGRAAYAGLVAWEPGHDHPVAYAQVSRGRAASWALDLAIDPHHRYDARAIAPELLHAALALIADEGGGHVHLWVHQPTATHDEVADAVGLVRGRDLLQLRVPLPLTEATPDIALRPFRPGVDEDAWLDVNNRAFDWHPEQGRWTRTDVEAREQEPWFDPEGFLLHEVDGTLAGFCWTKVHAEHDPPLGEIYVIAVDPDVAGRGLGRALTVAGLDHLARRGLEWGMLYVDAENVPARRLYEKLGFTVNHVDRAYTGDV